MSHFPKITDENIEDILIDNTEVLIIFSTLQCGYCQIAKKNLGKIINDLPQVSTYECIISRNPKIKERYKINSVPILKLIKSGEVVYTGFGVREAADLYYQLKSFLE